MDRRAFIHKGLLATVASYALLETLVACDGVEPKAKPLVKHWAIQLNEFCADLKTNTISPLQWQQKIEDLYQQIELKELLRFIDFNHLIKGFEYPDLGVSTRKVVFPQLDGLPENTAFIKKIFGMKKDRAIIPHGHSNMSSAHLILEGEMHLRHYEKIHQDGQNLIIKPTIDTIATRGESSSISDDKDNIHWFITTTERAFTFDVIMVDLNDRAYDIHNLDMYAAEDLKNGTFKAPMIDVETALNKYGKHHH